MGRFYADSDRLKQDEIFNTAALLSKINTMPLVDSFFKPALSTDRDGDVLMADSISAPPISPSREKFSFDWLMFDSNNSLSPKSPTFSPISPATPSRKLSMSTVSPTSYFHETSPVTPTTPKKSGTEPSNITTSPPRASQLVLPPPPAKPLNWVWQCHQCRSRYQLSVTRRCLIDGHYYCSGDTSQNQRNNKRRRKAQSCTSEFDYVGWQDWGQWRRKCTALRAYVNGKAAPKIHGCEGCSFPSQCRYESRPLVETVEFDKYIEEKDIAAIKKQEVEATVSPDKAASAEELGKGKERQIVTRATKKKGQKLAKIEASGEKVSQKNMAEKGSKRQRFYSSLAGNTSSADLSPTREASNPFDRGKFDPSLPSVSHNPKTKSPTATTTIPIDPALTQDPHSHSDDKHTDLETIEATLKAALAGQKSKSSPSSTPALTSRPQSQASSTSTPLFTRRVNSKLNNPEFEISPSDIINNSRIADNIAPSTPPGLTLLRIDSQQSLLTDFFRQGKNNKDKNKYYAKSYAEQTRRATSEADIASFLRLKTNQDVVSSASRSVASRHHTHDGAHARTRNRNNDSNSNASHFEDINLSPVTGARKAVFTEILGSPGLDPIVSVDTDMDMDVDVDVDSVKKAAPSVESGSGNGSDKTGSASGASGAFRLLNFGFGRK